jgi:ubiquinone/menaquinone biosynthesis C-methylase UbiE
MGQDAVFAAGKADQWFERNRAKLNADDLMDRDPILRLLRDQGVRPRHCIEVGAANGYRLEAIRQAFGSRVTAVEPSGKAVADGRRRFPHVRFSQSLAHQLTGVGDGEADLVLVSFVLHWVDRSRLLASVAEIDRVLEDGGALLIADFLPAAPQRVRYHHLPDQEVWTFKQDYAALFASAALYQVGRRVTLDYTTGRVSDNAPPENRFAITWLQKSLHGGYRVGELPAGLRQAEGAA